MTTATSNVDFKNVKRGHDGARAQRKVPHIHTGPVVHSKNHVAGEQIKKSLLHHHSTATFILFGWLKDHMRSSGELSGLCQITGGTKQHGRVAVMPASMHLSGIHRPVGQIILFGNIQSINVSSKPNSSLATLRILQGTSNSPHDSRARKTSVNFNTPRFETVGDQLRRVCLFEGRLWMSMQLVAPFGHFTMHVLQARDDVH